MNVRKKLSLIIAASTIVLLLFVYLLGRLILDTSVDAQETLRIRDTALRVVSTVASEIQVLDKTTNDYSAWDDTWNYVQDHNQAFVDSNIVPSTFKINEFSFLVILDLEGRTVLARAYEYDIEREIPLPEGLASHLGSGSPLLDHKSVDSSVTGSLSLGGMTFLVASRPIVKSDGEGPIHGTLVVGRALDDKKLSHLSGLLHLPLSLQKAGPAGLGAEAAASGADGEIRVRFLDGRRAEGAALFRDAYGRPGFILNFHQERVFRRQYLQAQTYFLAGLIVFAGFSLFFSRFLVHRQVTSRLAHLDSFVREIERTSDLSRRVDVSGRDELAGLSRTVNGMLDALQGRIQQIRDAEESIRKNEIKYHALFEASMDAVFLGALDGRIQECNRAASDLLGYSREELLGTDFSDLVPKDVRATLPEITDRLEKTGATNFESVMRAKSSELIPVEISIRRTEIGEGRQLVVFLRDLRARRKADKIRAALFEITQAASAAHDLKELYELIHSAVAALLPTNNFYIALTDADGRRLDFPYFIDEFDPKPSSKPLGKGLTEYVLRRGAPLLVSRDRIREMHWDGEIELMGTVPVDWLGVPLRAENRTIGVMAVQSYQSAIRFSEDDKAMLMFMSAQVAMAIERVRARERLSASLQEKDVLLREVHHRVKNNMQIISSLFNLQSGEIRDPAALDMLHECQGRIRSMALVHEKLYQSRDLARINFSDYILTLTVHLFHFWRVDSDRVRLRTELDDLPLDINTAIPCGLIINEMVSNALEHAFPDGRTGEILIRLRRLPDSAIQLAVRDDGVGLPPGFNPAESATLGLQIIGLLVKQLEGTLTVASSGGTEFLVEFRPAEGPAKS